ncbi:tyrosine-type recombinase/integrase [Massilia sp. LXY-6]|uniref:phage integrase n=1 Tax=Massilia sp. LXY-6 TaxID=3379823 RepID=UPI003EE12182
MLNLPIYLRGSSYYIHTRVAGRQFKRSLQTNDKITAIFRAVKIMELILSKTVKPEDFDLSATKNYEIDLSRGVFRADGPEDHQMMMDALNSIQSIKQSVFHADTDKASILPKRKIGLTMPEVLDKFFLVKSHLSQATHHSYTKAVNEFSSFLKNPSILNISVFDVTKYQEYLAQKKNTTRTIDNKISVLRTVFNFAIKQGYMNSENPAKERALQSGKSKTQSGYGIFEASEIKQIYHSDFFTKSRTEDPDYYWVLILALLTGCRISEITSLKKEQFKITESGVNYIKIVDSKTQAGERCIPISSNLLNAGLAEFIKDKDDKIFKYNLRLGKGSGNAVGKKFKRHLEEVKIKGDKLVFHSLRKFVNDFLLENEVPYEVRCQFMGHEVDDINIKIYTRKITVDNIFALLQRSLFKLEMLTGLIQTKF